MGELAYIYIFFLLGFLSVAVIILIQIRDKKEVLVEDKDFITEFLEKKKKQLATSLPSLSLRTYLILSAISPIVFGVILWMLLPNKSLAIIIAFFTILLPEFIVQIIIDTKKKKYEENYVRALKAFASSLRSGMSVQQGVREVVANPFIDSEIRASFQQIDSDITVGIGIAEAFANFAERADNDDARDVSAAIAMQTEVGGSEAKVIDSIASNIEERLMTKKEIRAVFAGTDFMIRAFDVLPFIALVIIYTLMPGYMEPIMSDPFLLAGLVLILLFTIYGSVIIRRTARKAKGE